MKKTYKYILFDWDGTLARTLDIWLDEYVRCCRKYNTDISKLFDLEIAEKSFGLGAEGLANLGVKHSKRVYKEVLEIAEKRVKTVDLYPYVKEVIQSLYKKGKKLSLHTSSFNNLIYPPLNYHKLKKYFEIVVTRDDVSVDKPNPEGIQKGLTFLKAVKQQSILIGDSSFDVKTAKNAGIDSVLFYPEINKKFYKEKLLMNEKPDYVISNLKELLKIVN